MDQQTLRGMLETNPDRNYYPCEGQEFEPHIKINEVLIPKNVFQKLPKKLRDYFYHPINCSLNCQMFHARWGHSRKFREWFRERVERIYGKDEVETWIQNAPLKLKRIK
jgi:hypothetical protein